MLNATAGKRPRSPPALTRPSNSIIDLTSDDDEVPAPKRAKSGTPNNTAAQGLSSRLELNASASHNYQRSTYFGTASTPSNNGKPPNLPNKSVLASAHTAAKTLAPKSGINGGHQQPPPVIISNPTTFRMPNTPPIKFPAVGVQFRNGVDDHDATSRSPMAQMPSNTNVVSKVTPTKTLTFDPHVAANPLEKVKVQPPDSVAPHKAHVRINQQAHQEPVRVSTPNNDNLKSDVPNGTPGGVHKTMSIRAPPTPITSRNSATPSSQPSQTIVVNISSPKKGILVNIPISDDKRKRREMREQLKLSTDLAKTNPEQVERILGQFGFSAVYATDMDEIKPVKITQPKNRQIDRTLIQLELGKTRRKKPSRDIVASMKNLSLVHPQEQVKAILTDRFGEAHNPPITFSNDINDNRLNGKFQFVSKYILRKGVRIGGQLARPSCKCIGPCQTDCACFTKLIKDSHGQRHLQMEFYEKRPDGLLVLTEDYLDRYDTEVESRVEISECNETCSCPPTCTNRVVQKGRTVPLDIFQTLRCGFGVRSPHDIVKGQFIELYLGEVITETELRRRESAQEEHETSYIYSLDWFEIHNPNNVYHVDGAKFGSAMRFVNHSCNPNARPFTVLNSRSTKQIHDVAFFAIRNIPAGTEITIDYSPQMEGEIHDVNDSDVVQCLCGSVNCRGKLWRPGQERRVNKKRLRLEDD